MPKMRGRYSQCRLTSQDEAVSSGLEIEERHRGVIFTICLLLQQGRGQSAVSLGRVVFRTMPSSEKNSLPALGTRRCRDLRINLLTPIRLTKVL